MAILGLLLGLLGGALVLAPILDLGRANLTVDFILNRLVGLVLGIGILLGSFLIYGRRYSTGGIVNLVLGIVVILTGQSQIGGILALISGVLGLVANEART